MTPNEKDLEFLKRTKVITCFWITKTQRRANFIQKLINSGHLELDSSLGYPNLKVKLKGM